MSSNFGSFVAAYNLNEMSIESTFAYESPVVYSIVDISSNFKIQDVSYQVFNASLFLSHDSEVFATLAMQSFLTNFGFIFTDIGRLERRIPLDTPIFTQPTLNRLLI